jgi:predicted outer membrane protein
MKKKNIILLTLGYLGGIAIAMKFSKKNAVETKKSLEKNPNFWDHFVENVVSIHKEVFRFFEEKAMSDDNMKLLEEYKGKAKSEVEKFKKEAESRIEELKEK